MRVFTSQDHDRHMAARPRRRFGFYVWLNEWCELGCVSVTSWRIMCSSWASRSIFFDCQGEVSKVVPYLAHCVGGNKW
jgi:hypothetical protein